MGRREVKCNIEKFEDFFEKNSSLASKKVVKLGPGHAHVARERNGLRILQRLMPPFQQRHTQF
jgi:hypothetical protein